MLVFLLSCLFGAVCAVGFWTACTAHTTIDEIVKRGGIPFPPGEPCAAPACASVAFAF
jgi:hypothetical protein